MYTNCWRAIFTDWIPSCCPIKCVEAQKAKVYVSNMHFSNYVNNTSSPTRQSVCWILSVSDQSCVKVPDCWKYEAVRSILRPTVPQTAHYHDSRWVRRLHCWSRTPTFQHRWHATVHSDGRPTEYHKAHVYHTHRKVNAKLGNCSYVVSSCQSVTQQCSDKYLQHLVFLYRGVSGLFFRI